MKGQRNHSEKPYKKKSKGPAKLLTESATETTQPDLSQDVLVRDIRRMALAVPAVALLAGVAAAFIEAQYGLLMAAFILGWTQLVGL